MAVATKLIKNRLRSIRNTRKITNAMELVAAAKMRKSVGAVLAGRPYANTAWGIAGSLQGRLTDVTHPLLTPRTEIKSVAMVVIASNRGLCGGFNAQVFQAAAREMRELVSKYSTSNTVTESWIAVGQRAGQLIARAGKPLTAAFAKSDVKASTDDVRSLRKMLVEGYLNGTYDMVVVAYTDFFSAMIQKPRVKQLLPFPSLTISDMDLGATKYDQTVPEQTGGEQNQQWLFEPSASIVLDTLLPHLLEMELYHAVLESTASEHAARMMAMRNASDSAGDMIDDLTLTYNQARQAAITREIAEISSGKAALE